MIYMQYMCTVLNNSYSKSTYMYILCGMLTSLRFARQFDFSICAIRNLAISTIIIIIIIIV